MIAPVPRFLIERTFTVPQEQMPTVGKRSKQVARDYFPEVGWEHSHVVVDDEGRVRTYCIYSAPSEEAVLGHASKLGDHTVDVVTEIAGDVTPDDFPLEAPARA